MKSVSKSESFTSRLGFILISAGCAIGLGNIWRFPYIVGKNGGAIFVLIYLVCLAALGIPIMTMEFAVGRAAGVGPVHAFAKIKGKKTKWSVLGITSFAGNAILMFFYTSITGWLLSYTFKMAKGEFSDPSVNAGEKFGTMLQDPLSMTIWTVIVILIGFGICSLGFNKGVERLGKFMMSALLILILALVIRSVTLPGAVEGIKFYLIPNLDNIKDIGLGTVIYEAMNQSFFTLSLGIGAMAIFGSRTSKEHSLFGESVNISILDTLIAFLAGLVIFPATAAYGIETSQGPGLIFVTLPTLFSQMAGGRIWGSLFFIFMFFAALTTVLAVFENIITCLSDLTGFSRAKSVIISIVGITICSIPAILGFNLWSHIQPLGPGSGILDLEDFIVSAHLLPLGSLGYLLFSVLKSGWGYKNFLAEANTGKGVKFPAALRFYVTYIIPVLVLFIFAMGYVLTFFKK